MQGEELLPYWPFYENEKKQIKQRNVTFRSTRHKKSCWVIFFVKELYKVFNWHNLGNLHKQFDVCDADKSLDAETVKSF